MVYFKQFTILFFFVLISQTAFAQNEASYQVANRLMQQQRYQEALPILENISADQPDIYVFLDRLVECRIQLKQYDEAIATVQKRITSGQNVALSNVLLGTLYHFKGDTARAYEIWDSNLAANPHQHQLYINTANKMVDRKEFLRAIEVYRTAQRVFNSDVMFLGEIPQVYMQAGEYQKAIAEWLTLIEMNPQQSIAFKRLLIRYNDPLLYDDSVAEIEFKLEEMNLDHPAYDTFYQLQIWLLFENKLYRRAFAAAREYERITDSYNYALYNVGRNLIENNEFELALEAFDFYKQAPYIEVKWGAYEQQANAYMRWAKFLEDNRLDFSTGASLKYRQASALLDTMINEGSNYSRIHNAYLLRAEIALDHLFDLEAAKSSANYLKTRTNLAESPEAYYLDGRIELAEKNFAPARIALTRANKMAKVGELAEKTRYFLALTDFYAGDFEFAKIQLKALGRKNTSYYANDALELRLWLQEGLSADTTGTSITEFASVHFLKNTGKHEDAVSLLKAIIGDTKTTPFKDDAFLMLSGMEENLTPAFYAELSQFIANSPFLSQKEQFLWLKANISEVVNTQCETSNMGCINPDEVITNFETLILEYPQGFYAPYARKRLNQLPKTKNS